MAWEWASVVPSLISTASGLGGVFLGAKLTSTREAKRETDKAQMDARYLAILVSAHLERFAYNCLVASQDDGTIFGQPAGKDGTHKATSPRPTFDPLSLSVEWKSLPADLMYEILNLPYRTEVLSVRIAEVWEDDFPPDYPEFFWARQHGYATLGLDACTLAKRLRKHAGLPELPLPTDGSLTQQELLRGQLNELEEAAIE